MSIHGDEQTQAFFEVMARTGVYPNAGNLRFYLSGLFQGISFEGKRMLDIGAGTGLCGIYGATVGAQKVICLEPEAAGSTAGVRRGFDSIVESLGLRTVTMQGATLQEFDAGADKFDIVLLHDSINHLDEQACINLHRDEKAWGVYREVVGKLFSLSAEGASLIIADCARRNLFGDIGVRNPVASTIEWHKHQSPKLWARLLHEVGFRNPRIHWDSLNTLRHFGRILLGNSVGAYLSTSHFRLTMNKLQ